MSGVAIIEHPEDAYWEYEFDYQAEIFRPGFSEMGYRVCALTFEADKECTAPVQDFIQSTQDLRL